MSTPFKFIITSTHEEGEPNQAYVQRKLEIALSEADNSVIDGADGSFTINSETLAAPITGQIYTRYFVVDGEVVGAELPEAVAKDIENVVPSRFYTEFESDNHTVQEYWEF